jgi:D-glycero-D-manno-heptose 1,7-bisphosphate phosphatase
MRLLQDAGFTLAIATNQPGPAKGQMSAVAVQRTNDALVARLAREGVRIGALEVCLHHPEGGPGGDPTLVRDCACRKPKPGLLVSVIGRLGGDPAASWMIGDSAGDIEAGHAAGLRAALVFAPNRCELCPLRQAVGGARTLRPDAHGATLLEIAHTILHAA